MKSRQKYTELLSDAYQHLYDMVYLRGHELARLLFTGEDLTGKEKAWQLHNLLVETVQELNPGPQAPVNSPEWRRYRLMELRFINGAEPQEVADQLFISRRHFYRELPQALEACADLLLPRIAPSPSQVAWDDTADLPGSFPQAENPTQSDGANRLDLVRQEAARFQHDNLNADVNETIQNALAMLGEVAAQRGIFIETGLNDCLPTARIDRSILRQVLLGLINFLLSLPGSQQIHIASAGTGRSILVTYSVHASIEAQTLIERADAELAVLQELAALNRAELRWTHPTVSTGMLHRLDFILTLPVASRGAILLADDNPDIRRLVCSMLQAHYHVIEAETGAQVIRLAEEVQPQAILLDLMMPEGDGWEALQYLKNSEKTRHIPVIVCSVLDMKDLAFSLGAVGFLNKPVGEKDLLLVLETVQRKD